MNYYGLRARAISRIDAMYEDDHDVYNITYEIETKFGFGERFVRNRIELLEKIKSRQNQDQN